MEIHVYSIVGQETTERGETKAAPPTYTQYKHTCIHEGMLVSRHTNFSNSVKYDVNDALQRLCTQLRHNFHSVGVALTMKIL